MNEQQPWYVEQRALALALMYLTRRNDLIVRQEHPPDHGIDLIVELVDNDRPTRRVFGVQLKARTSITADEIATEAFVSKLHSQQWLEELPFPVCLFIFSVRDSVGFYKWLTQPVITSDGAPKLRLNVTGEFAKLDTAGLGTIVTEVNQWYDALTVALAA